MHHHHVHLNDTGFDWLAEAEQAFEGHQDDQDQRSLLTRHADLHSACRFGLSQTLVENPSNNTCVLETAPRSKHISQKQEAYAAAYPAVSSFWVWLICRS